MLAQGGVVAFIFWMLAGIWGPLGGELFLPLFLPTWMWMPFFVVSALIPGSDRDDWGSIWPLSGYDNAIDAIYTRGPWLVRYEELEELEAERNVADGLNSLFGPNPTITK